MWPLPDVYLRMRYMDHRKVFWACFKTFKGGIAVSSYSNNIKLDL